MGKPSPFGGGFFISGDRGYNPGTTTTLSGQEAPDMIKRTMTASTTPTDPVRCPLSGEGSFAVTASTIADGVKLQAAADPEGNWYDLAEVEVTTSGGTVNFKTDLYYLRAVAISGAVTAEEILISGQE